MLARQTKKANKKNLLTPGFIVNWRRFLSCSLFTLLEIIAVKIYLFDSLLTKWRTPVLNTELQMLAIQPSEKVLHLGCGAFPSATLQIAQGKGRPVVGIDNNYIAVKLAQSYIKKKGLSNLVTIEYADGISYPIHDFDVIYIAINVWPIDKVLFHLAQTMKSSARILCKGFHQDIAELLNKKEFHVLFSIHATLDYPKIQSFVLTKKVNL
jgi:precorrin-6B methylase 2